MKRLLEICKIITQNRVQQIELLDRVTLSKKGDKLGELYKGIVKGKFDSDVRAAAALYGSTPDDRRFVFLKSNFKHRIYNNLFFLDFNSVPFSTYHKAKLKCSKSLALCNILSTYGARQSAIDLAKATMSRGVKFGLHDVVVGCARLLKDYAAASGAEKEYKAYREVINEHEHLLKLDMMAEDYYQMLIVHYSQSVATKSELGEVAERYLGELDGYVKGYHSFTLEYYYFRIWATMFQMKGDYKAALGVYKKFEGFVNASPRYYQKKVMGNIYASKLACFLHLDDFEKGRQAARLCLRFYAKGSNNWFFFNEVYFLLAFRTGEYVHAKEIFNGVVFHAKFSNLSSDRREKWVIYEAYLNLLLMLGKLNDMVGKRSRTKRFYINDFLKQVPIFSKDKRGYNIAILVIHILFLLHQRDYNRIIDRMDALKLYHSRHLKREEDLRSKLFIKMLLVMEKQSFDYAKTKEKAQKYLDQMQSHQFQYEGTPIDAEIVPYETLWGMVLGMLKE